MPGIFNFGERIEGFAQESIETGIAVENVKDIINIEFQRPPTQNPSF